MRARSDMCFKGHTITITNYDTRFSCVEPQTLRTGMTRFSCVGPQTLRTGMTHEPVACIVPLIDSIDYDWSLIDSILSVTRAHGCTALVFDGETP